jgi:hypothetical protein
MTLLTIRIEGGLLSPDFLETIHDQPGPEVWPMTRTPRSYGELSHRRRRICWGLWYYYR